MTTTSYNASRYKSLSDERAQVLANARKMLDHAKAEDRDPDRNESAAMEAGLARVKELDVELKEQGKAMVTAVMSLGNSETNWDGKGASLFDETAKAGFLHAAQHKTSYGTTIQMKAATLGGSLLPPAGGRVSPMPPGLGAFPLRSLFTEAEAGSPTVRYYRMGAGTATVTAEGAAKTDAGVTTTPVDAALIKIAGTFQISDELAEDAAFLVAAISQEVILSVLVKENEEVVAAMSAASGIFTATGTAATALDVVATAVGLAESRDGITPGALVLNPVDLATIRKAKASTAGSYYVDPLAPGPSSVHGVPLVSTAAVASGTAYLVTQGAGVFYTRGGIRVDSGYNADDWQKNLITYRVEERILPAIVRPGLITKITLT